MEKSKKLQVVREAVQTYHNFPKDGILFRDVFGIFQNVIAMRALKDLLVEHTLLLQVDKIVGLDSRGFLIGPLISVELGKPFLPIRKKGKLPGYVVQKSYTLEYGEEIFEIQADNIDRGTRILIVDDLLATGGSMGAAIELLENCGAEIVECLVVMELSSLKGRHKIGVPVHSLIQYD
ncbi:adenine phosphoribosyltransferase [Venturia canescens]|uniref:adenine phosphoribosyltransferase n=1 Tax=Venturia canescens TaxID=32260 RepID=UPI001C9CE099|nr:adenine phosphoribosyltransferase [Venturia canescens]XP_043279792.1 adenine phosphoribosyltransferase [Venturia canescens]